MNTSKYLLNGDTLLKSVALSELKVTESEQKYNATSESISKVSEGETAVPCTASYTVMSV